jgi:cyclopropane-fatty-acyl-phospholipid synthase
VPDRTEPLRREIAALLPERPLHVELWDGTRVDASDPAAPTMRVLSPRALGHVLRAPGQLGIARAYVAGDVDTDDLDRAIPVVDNFRPPPLAARARARLAAAALRAMGPRALPRRPRVEARIRGRRHGRARDARAVRYHYDVPSEFFALFLDRSMTYSCALWSRGARTLEEAQEQKLDLVCRKLELRPGQRVLDVGCGWGAFAVHAATRCGARVLGITLSESQAAWARARVERLGLGDRVEIRVMDYRDLSDQRFDAVVSIGMAEHVGERRIDEYAARLARAVRPGGFVLNHAIARLSQGSFRGGPFSERYVFPDGEALHLSRTLRAFEQAGCETLHTEELRRDYVQTLSHWILRLDARLAEAERLAGAQRTRAWRLYLRGARGGFQRGSTGVYQTLLVRDWSRPPWHGPAAWERPSAGEEGLSAPGNGAARELAVEER